MATTQPGVNNEAFQYEKEVFVSYAWGGESERIVDELEQAFDKHGIRIVRDKKDLNYKGSIEAFEKRIGQGQCIILVISDKYLCSEHCMYELLEVDKSREFRKRIFPIVLADAPIYDVTNHISYITFWRKKANKLEQDMLKTGPGAIGYMSNIQATLKKFRRIGDNFDDLIGIIKDMNTLAPNIHAASGFSTLISEVEKVLAGKQIVSQNNKVKVRLDEIADKKPEQFPETTDDVSNAQQIEHTITVDIGWGTFSINDLSKILQWEFGYFQENCAIITEQLCPSYATRQFALQYATIWTEWPDRDPDTWPDSDPETVLQLAKQRVDNQNQRLKKYNELTGKNAKNADFADRLLEDIHHLYAFVTLKELSNNLNDDWDKYLGIYNKLHTAHPWHPLYEWREIRGIYGRTTEQVLSEYKEIHTWLESQSTKTNNWINDHVKNIPIRTTPTLDNE
jgi:hypothetical protein